MYTYVPFHWSPSNIIWYWPNRWQINRDIIQCNSLGSPVSVIPQCNLVSSWGLLKWEISAIQWATWLWKDYTLLRFYFVTVHVGWCLFAGAQGERMVWGEIENTKTLHLTLINWLLLSRFFFVCVSVVLHCFTLHCYHCSSGIHASHTLSLLPLVRSYRFSEKRLSHSV